MTRLLVPQGQSRAGLVRRPSDGRVDSHSMAVRPCPGRGGEATSIWRAAYVHYSRWLGEKALW